jgi:hypothetical protein
MRDENVPRSFVHVHFAADRVLIYCGMVEPALSWTCLQVLGRVSYRSRLLGYAVTGSACASVVYACVNMFYVMQAR